MIIDAASPKRPRRDDVLAPCRGDSHHSQRPAGATRCTVRLRRLPAVIELVVEDDGRGLAATPADVGLRSMRERATELCGIFEISPRPGGGTRVQATLPVGAP